MKRRLNENYEIDASNCLWINGTTKARYDVASNRFPRTDIYHPLFMTNSIPYAFEYCKQHASKDYADGQSGSRKHQHAVDGSNTIVVFMKLKEDTLIFDFTDEADYELLGFDKKYMKIFDKAEPYFAWNSQIHASIDSRPVEFAIAAYYLRYLNSTAGRSNKTFYRDGVRPFKQILFTRDLDTSHLDAKSYSRFFQHFKNANWEQDGAYYDEVKKHHVDKDGNNLTVSELQPAISSEQIELVNTYLDFFAEFKRSAAKLGIASFEDADKKMQAIFGEESKQDDGAACYVDILQIVLFKRIAEVFEGFYCPEKVAQKLYNIDPSSTLDAIALFSNDPIEESISYQCKEIVEWHSIATRNEHLSKPAEILAYVKQNLDANVTSLQKRWEIADALQKKRDAEERAASESSWMPLKKGLPCRKQKKLEELKDKLKTFSVALLVSSKEGRAFYVKVNALNEKDAQSIARGSVRKAIPDASNVIVSRCTQQDLNMDLSIPLVGVKLDPEDKEGEKALLAKSYHRSA